MVSENESVSEDEVVLYSDSPPMFKNNPIGFLIAVALIAAFGLGIILLLFWYISCRSHKLTITKKELVNEEGILSKTRTELRVSNIRTVRVKQSFFQRMFGVGDIELFTSGDLPEITLKGMPNPAEIRDLLK